MTGVDFSVLLDQVDPRYLDEADGTFVRKSASRRWLTFGGLAAALLLICVLGILWFRAPAAPIDTVSVPTDHGTVSGTADPEQTDSTLPNTDSGFVIPVTDRPTETDVAPDTDTDSPSGGKTPNTYFPPEPEHDIPALPIFADAKLSAKELFRAVSFWLRISSGGSAEYDESICPTPAYLSLDPIPKTDTVPVYGYDSIPRDGDAEFLSEWFSGFCARFSELTGEPEGTPRFSEYTEEYREAPASGDWPASVRRVKAEMSVGQNWIYGSSNGIGYYLMVGPKSGGDLDLGENRVSVDPMASDAEILDRLSGFRDQVFRLTGRTFSDAKVTRSHYEYETTESWRVTVTYYSAADHPLAVYDPTLSDYVSLRFNLVSGIGADFATKKPPSSLSLSGLSFRIVSKPTQTSIPVAQTVPLISLSDAEALLYNGCTFGGHEVPYAEGEKPISVDFYGYDLVSFTYLPIYDPSVHYTARVTGYVPFYVFFKQIGVTARGDPIYAHTNVPAIELSGYDAYLRSGNTVG